MTRPPALLLITWNRRHYVEKTVQNLLSHPSEFQLYCWDNGSVDGTADVIADLDDSRIERRMFSAENVRQREPCLWFFENAQSDLIGKIDDDILLPRGWLDQIAPIVRECPRAGMLGCWIYMPEDWDEHKARHKITRLKRHRIFRNSWIAGQSFLARRDLVSRYVKGANEGYGFPVDQHRMTARGYVNGYPLPLILAHNMDDPRSEHCLMNKPGGMGEQAALTARKRGFKTPEVYASWIKRDAEQVLKQSLREQAKQYHVPRWRQFARKAKQATARCLQALVKR